MDWSQDKVRWKGEVASVQPRTEVWRYISDNRSHRAVGYCLYIRGTFELVEDDEWGFDLELRPASKKYDVCDAISEMQQQKLQARIGYVISGTGWTPLYPNQEFADFYRLGALKKIEAVGKEQPCETGPVARHRTFDDNPIPNVDSSKLPGPP